MSLDQQSRLLSKMGKDNCSITRIFIGTEQMPLKENSPYRSAINLMEKYGIDARYVYDPDTKYLDMTWMPELNCVMFWNEQKGGEVVSISVQSDSEHIEELNKSWNTLVREAKEQQQ